MNSKENLVIKKKFSKKFYERVDELYDYIIKTGCLPDDNSDYCFSDGVKFQHWLYDNLYKFYAIKDENEKARVILSIYEQRTNNRELFLENNFNNRLTEVYNYYLSNNKLPSIASNVLFSDGVKMGLWLHNNIDKLEEIKDINLMAAKILLAYVKNQKNEHNKDLKLSITDRIDEIYKYYIEKKELPDKKSNAMFSDQVNMSKWIEENIAKLYKIHNANQKASIIFTLYTNQKRRESVILPKDMVEKISELYFYLLKFKKLPSVESNDTFSDGINIRSWLENNIDILENIKCSHLYAHAIMKAYRLEVSKKRLIIYYQKKLDEFYNIYQEYGIPYIFKNKIKFNDGVDMPSWFLRNIKRLNKIKGDKRVIELLDSYEKYLKSYGHENELIDEFLKKRIDEVFEYCSETHDMTMIRTDKTFSDGKRYKFWIQININKLRKVKHLNLKIQKLVIAYDFSKSMEYNKLLIELSNQCLKCKKIPGLNSGYRFSNGNLMGVWFNNNKINIWNNRRKNPYCLKLIKVILSINQSCFDNLNSNNENISSITNNKAKVFFKTSRNFNN